MKIAIVTPTFPPYAGGIGNVAAFNARQLVSHGHQVTVFTPQYKMVAEEATDLEVRRIKPLIKYGNAAFVPALGWMLKGYDLVHIHYPFFGGAETVWLYQRRFKKQKTKIVLHYHMDVVGEGIFKLIFKIHRAIFLPKIIKMSDRVIVTSIDYAKNSNIAGMLAKTPAKFIEVPNGVDANHFAPQSKDESLLQKHQINQTDKVVLFVGGLDKAHYFKGIEYLVEAMSILKQATYEWRLVVVGEGELRRDYQDLAAQLGIDNKVIFTGYVPNDDLVKYYNVADVVVLPSVDKSEAFGLTLVEGMSCAKAVIASNLAGVRGVIDQEINGLVVQPRDANDLATKVNFILMHQTLAGEYGLAGREKVLRKYNWKIIGEQLDNLYKNL
ncbi:MAG: glycosyltransferase family 4 protein [Candidatus Buchananbacteria bacterium]|nr:glycosyltransferase family 4 protein [Candidatus Buchananbacteria bacterium]